MIYSDLKAKYSLFLQKNKKRQGCYKVRGLYSDQPIKKDYIKFKLREEAKIKKLLFINGSWPADFKSMNVACLEFC